MSVNKEDQKFDKEIQAAEPLPVTTAPNTNESFTDIEGTYLKYQKQINTALAVLAIAILGFVGFKYYIGTQEEEAASQSFQAEYYWEADSLDKALKGDGNYPGFIEIADNYGLTKSGNLAKYRAGVALLKQGKFEDAIGYLNDFSSNDRLVQARAYSLVGDAHMELKQFEDAAKLYGKAADYKKNKEFTPGYLLKLGLAQEKSSDLEGAYKTYSKLLDEYPLAPAAGDAKKYKGLVESQLGK